MTLKTVAVKSLTSAHGYEMKRDTALAVSGPLARDHHPELQLYSICKRHFIRGIFDESSALVLTCSR